MRRFLFALLLVWPLSAFSEGAALRFGLFPNLSSQILLEVHQPLADYLTRKLNRPVYLETAPDFASFVKRTREGNYDILLTPPHLAYLANTESGYQPLYSYQTPIKAILVVRKDSPIHKLADLKGRTIAMADPLALVTMAMEAELAQAGMQEGRDFVRVEAGSHNNAALLVSNGKADGGVLGLLPYQHLSDQIKQSLRTLTVTRTAFLSQVYLASAGLRGAEYRQLVSAMNAFPDTPEGRTFFLEGDLGGLKAVTPQELKAYQSFGEEAARRLRQGRP